MPEEGLFGQIKRFVVGEPIPSHLAHHERLSRVTGLAVLSSDPLSSVAYATEEILRVLILVNVSALVFATPIALVIASILAIVVFSYRQTIHAYPNGGGAYIVARENLGEIPSLVAASALLIDYILTVAVSIAAGVAALTSAFPQWIDLRVQLTLAFLLILMLGNLRGIRESGNIFAAPTYFFIISLLTLIAVGTWRTLTGTVQPVVPIEPMASTRPAAHFVSPPEGFLKRLHGHDRCGGSVQRRPGLQTTGSAQCRGHHGDHGRAVDHDVRRHHIAGAAIWHHSKRA